MQKRHKNRLWSLILLLGMGCSNVDVGDDIPEDFHGPVLADPSPESSDEMPEDEALDGVPGVELSRSEIDDLPLLEPTEVGRAVQPPERDFDSPGIDLVEPAPTLQAEWIGATDSPSFRDLTFQVTNRQDREATFGLNLLHDDGTTRAHSTPIARLDIPAHSTASYRIPPSDVPLPSHLKNAGMLQFSVEDGEGLLEVLPSLFISPGTLGDPQLLTENDLLEEVDESDQSIGERTVQWFEEQEPRGALNEIGGVASTTSALTADEYRTCVRWQARTTDSGLGEDRISFANGNSALVTAYGVRIRVSQGSWNRTLDTSPTTGCATWSTSRNGPFSVRVYYYVEDTNGNAIRYHDAGDSVFGTYPGTTYRVTVNGYNPSRGQTSYISAGNWSSRATTMATASMVSRYYAGYTSNTQIHIADDLPGNGGGSSAHHCSSDCRYSSGDAYVRLQTSGTNHRRQKFVTAHELGHARAILRQGRLERNIDTTLASGGCANGSSYTPTSREWNSVGLREGYAHFVAARTFNFTSTSHGTFAFFNTPYDLEGPVSTIGGIIENNCGGATSGHTTNIDVLRMMWDWDTPDAWSSRAERRDISDTYLRAANSSPGRSEYWEAFRDAAEHESDNAEQNTLRTAGAMNGMHDLL